MKTILKLALALFWMNGAVAQWIRIEAIPSQSIGSLAVNSDTIYATSLNNVLYKSSDGGSTWTMLTVSPMPIAINTVGFFNNRIYVGTEHHGIFYSTDNGVNWQQIVTNTYGISGFTVKNNTLYAGTKGNGVLMLNNATDTWLPMNNGLSLNFSGTVNSILSTSDYLFIDAGANGTFYKYDFSADNWQEGYYYGSYIPGLSMSHVINNGPVLFAAGGRRLTKSIDSGNNWMSDNVGTHIGMDRRICEGTENHYLITNTFDGTNGSWVQKRSKSSAIGSSWAIGEEYLADGYCYDVLEYQNKLFLAKADGLYVKNMGLGVAIPAAFTDLILFPNPSEGKTIQVWSGIEVVKYSIFNTMGQLVKEAKAGTTSFNIQSDFQRGVYLVVFSLFDGSIAEKKLVVN